MVTKIKIKQKITGTIVLCLGLLLIGIFPGQPTFAAADTRYDAGLNLPFNEKAGNVNPQTGNVSIEVTDLELPGRGGLNFKFSRFWNLNQSNTFTMYCSPDDGSNKLNSETMERFNRLGVGWSTNLPYIFKDNSSGTQVINLCFNGSVFDLDPSGLALYKSKINPDKTNILWYDLLDLRVYQETGIKYGDYAGFNIIASQYGIADEAYTWNEYVLILKDNSKYWFRSDGRLMMHEDRTGLNRIWYFYDSESRLKLVVDTAERKIRFSYDANSNITGIEWDVELRVKLSNGQREWQTQTRRITYQYQSAEQFNAVNSLKPVVVNYRQPFILTRVIDPEECFIRYDYQEGRAYFTYNSFKERSQNVYLLLKEITSMEDGSRYRNKQFFEYEVPVQGLYSKEFYQGYIEYYKISRQYFKDRNGRIMNDTTYIYHDQGEAGNSNQYTAVLQQGNVKTTFVYSISAEKSRDNVLDKLLTETQDGFKEERDFVYNANRAKITEEVYRGQFIYREKFDYDLKGNLKWYEDKIGLITVTEYDEKFSIPRHITKKLEVGGTVNDYQTEYIINTLGQVEKEIIYLEQTGGSKRAVTIGQYQYDQYGNLIKTTDAAGNSVHTVYDANHHVFPVKVYQDVTIASWQGGDIAGDNWFNEPDGNRRVTVRNWKVFNNDGTVWLEIDNDGYAIEHYYDKKGNEVETVIPDLDDTRSFSGTNFDDFRSCPEYQSFLTSRGNNPKVRNEISYSNDYVKTFIDLDVSQGAVKVIAKQGDGMGHIEEEIEYDQTGSVYGVKRMTYDTLGRMLGLTDPDSGSSFYYYPVNGEKVARYDKTWITEYDDLGRKIRVIYPETEPGWTDTKRFAYNDIENSVTITDSLGRKIYEKRDWNGNLVKKINYGGQNTRTDEVEETNYLYDKLNRLVKLEDPKGITTAYRYDERDLLLEENYGTTGSDKMEYNDLGLLVKKTDRKGQVIVMQYDEMKRNTAVIHYKTNTDFQTGTTVRQVKTSYDNRGNAVWVGSDSLIERYSYGHTNKVTLLERRLKDQTLRGQVAAVWGGDPESQKFSFAYDYNDAGMVTRMAYPDGSIHRYHYDGALGRLQQLDVTTENGVQSFINSISYTPSGVVTKMHYANGTSQTWNFDNRKRINRIQVTGPSGTLEDLNYKLNQAGDILAINENEYNYDGFDRIIGAKTLLPGNTDQKKLVAKHFGTYKDGDPINGISYFVDADLNQDGRINGADHTLASLLSDALSYDLENFEYDKNGNRTKLLQNGDTYIYQYGDRNCLETVYLKKKGATSSNPFLKFTYDANGNTVERVLYTQNGEVKTSFGYGTMNRVLKSTEGGNVTEYLYDNAGNRFIKKNAAGVTLYLRHGQTAVAMDLEVPTTVTTYRGKLNRYVLSGELLAGRITEEFKVDGAKNVSVNYYHLDHLNSTKCVSNQEGKVEVRYIYRAFGGQLAKLGGGIAKYTYGGKELDGENGLYYFNARYYDAEIGRFISVDPAKDGLNCYSYCDDNPLNCIDPNGLRTYFVNGINNANASGPPDYAVAFSNELTSRGIADVRTYGAYNNESGLRGTLDGVSKVTKEMDNINVYSSQLAEQIASDLANNPLAEGEQLNLIGYSGGGQVVLNAAEKLNGIATINNTVLIGAPIEEVFNNTGNVTVIWSGCDPLSWTVGWGFDSEFAGWIGHTDYFSDSNIDNIADMVDDKID